MAQSQQAAQEALATVCSMVDGSVEQSLQPEQLVQGAMGAAIQEMVRQAIHESAAAHPPPSSAVQGMVSASQVQGRQVHFAPGGAAGSSQLPGAMLGGPSQAQGQQVQFVPDGGQPGTGGSMQLPNVVLGGWYRVAPHRDTRSQPSGGSWPGAVGSSLMQPDRG